MVFFSCNACNETLKKNQVEKHYMQKCRRCEYLNCLDCGKEFWGDSYQTHTKCISEAEKYSSKDFVAKANKGEVKQEQWIQKVQSAIQKAPSNPQLKNLLQRLEDFPNVPRKRSKFENFLKCSLRVVNKGLVEQVWGLLMAETQSQNQNGSSTATNGESNAQSIATPSETVQTETADPESKEGEDSEKKLSKRERKEERKRKAHKTEKKDKHGADSAVVEEEDSGKTKKKKRKNREDEEEVMEEEKDKEKTKKGKRKKRDEEEVMENDSHDAEVQPKKKKRKVEPEATEVEATMENGTTHKDSVQTDKKGRFDWGAIILAVLTSKGEMSVKRLQKKVLAEYASYGSNKPEESVQAKFHRKLKKMPNVRVLKDRAAVVQS